MPNLIVRSFQEDTQFEDVLGLQNKVEGALINLSARGTDAPVLYMEAKDYPGAYTLNGRYRVEGELITVSCKVFRTTAVTGEFVVKGQKNKLPDLAEQILAQAQQVVK